MPEYPVTVVVPTRVGWPLMRLSMDALLPQVEAVGAQLIVADASGVGRPDWAAAAHVIWLEMPGADGPDLRQAAYAAADAPIVAITEDHAAPASDWLATIVAEHADHPEAAAIFGMVENGSPDHLVDWALYGVGYLPWAPPSPAANGNPGHANLSFKTWAFSHVVPEGDEVLEFRYVDGLRRAGHQVVASNRLRVTHFQSTGIVTTSKLFFHNGRAIAAVRRQRMTGPDWLRAVAPGLMAGFRTLRTLRIARTKPALLPVMVRSAPLIALLHLLHAIGESVGYLDGPGDSPSHLH